jgi:hypothetical protein
VRTIHPWLVVGCVLHLAACGSPPDTCASCPPVSAATTPSPSDRIRIRALSNPLTIDGRVTDWPASHVVARWEGANPPQWDCIRGRCPHPLADGDLDLTVYMAWDPMDQTLYAAVQATDDRIVPSRDPQHPYSGDCVELFLATARPSFTRDFHALVASPSTDAQAAFLQLELTPQALPQLANHFPSHRTDACLRRRLQGMPCEPTASSGGAGRATPARIVSVQHRADMWSAEAAIPLRAFSHDVVQRIVHDGGEFRLAIAYADYDDPTGHPDPSRPDHDFGFRPDHVFSLDSREHAVNAPARMRRAVLVK